MVDEQVVADDHAVARRYVTDANVSLISIPCSIQTMVPGKT